MKLREVSLDGTKTNLGYVVVGSARPVKVADNIWEVHARCRQINEDDFYTWAMPDWFSTEIEAVALADALNHG